MKDPSRGLCGLVSSSQWQITLNARGHFVAKALNSCHSYVPNLEESDSHGLQSRESANLSLFSGDKVKGIPKTKIRDINLLIF